ncbi:MAG: efflux RND transporter permease subunit [Acidobacteria bacterium]|jgi:HAE1 family hydrophobic/amphiphilic exporter-1|nr:efflux RND transporter permease subunit [Acidobacteriota bacterium]
MKIVNFSTRRPVTVTVFALAGIIFGLVAFRDLAVDLLPNIAYPSLTIRTELDGVAPAEIETLLTRPVENAVGVVNGVVSVTSSSRADRSEVTLEFGWGTNMDFAALDVRERLDLLQLPDDAIRPVLLRYDPSLDPVMRIGLTGDEELVRLRLIGDREVKRLLERVEGVAGAIVAGGLEEEIEVEIDERRLASLGLTVEQVVTRLAQENVNLTGGRLQDGQAEFLVRTIMEIERAQDLNDIIVDSGGQGVVRLQDIARIIRGHKEREVITRINGREAVEIAIYKEGGTNTVTVVDRVTGQLDSVRERLRATGRDLDLTVITDQARYIRQSVSDVLQSALFGGILAVLVLSLFLRDFRSTAIIAISIPISVVTAFLLMYLSDISLNIMSLGGLTLGIGLLVDNSIVVLESVQRKRDEGMGAVEAAQIGAGEVGQAVTASTLTTICVFVPIVFVEGVAGQLFGDQAMTVTYSLAVSLIVALTVIPMLASRQLVRNPESIGPPKGAIGRLFFPVTLLLARAVKAIGLGIDALVRFFLAIPFRLFDAGFGWVRRTYPKVLEAALARRGPTLGAALFLFVGSVLLIPTLGTELVPELIQGEFFVDAELPPGTQLDVTARRLANLERFAMDLPGVTLVYGVAGTSRQQGGIAGELRENLSQLTIRVAPPVSREKETALMNALRPELEREGDYNYLFGRPSYFSFKTPIELEIRGYNLKLLERLADEAVRRMKQIPGLVDVKSSTEGGNPELQIRFNRQRLATLGLSVQQVASVVRSKVLGDIVTDITREDRTIDIRLRVEEKYRDSAQDLANLNVAQAGSTAIPLSAVAEVTETLGPAEIRRADGERMALITANLDGRDLGSASADIQAALAKMTLPVGFDARLGGQRQEMETSFASMRFAILLAVFMVYLVMASQFESLLHPFVILISVPLSLIGVVGTLFVFRISLSVVVLIGMILLAGIVVNNAIILIDYTNRLRAEGMAKLEALKRAGEVRLRPILMTTATTVLGLLPMAISHGEGSELRSPMALTVIGGLLVSTALTLVIIPVVYSILDRSE